MNNDLISRQQAMEEIDEWIKVFRENGHKESAADACLIQDGIIQLPPAQPEPCDDAVSRKEVKDGFVEMCSLICPYTEKQRHTMCGSCLLGTAFDVLEATQPVTPKQRKEILYRHYKGGTYELVCNYVTHTETGESLVIYRDCRGKLWARPESMFYGLVKVGDDLVPRFVLFRSEGDAE